MNRLYNFFCFQLYIHTHLYYKSVQLYWICLHVTTNNIHWKRVFSHIHYTVYENVQNITSTCFHLWVLYFYYSPVESLNRTPEICRESTFIFIFARSQISTSFYPCIYRLNNTESAVKMKKCTLYTRDMSQINFYFNFCRVPDLWIFLSAHLPPLQYGKNSKKQ